eukprot:CAMPEP_0203744206 /NCGR_PEP_ID=MMETSP0098-20131031/362_1 /ASSEMBLY_ACC=CAM_ASM_000208 /TAXON_ID=96639 /ORGANISM=" , Strain NY0313808BC1" /LENGTH=310 /DNA_ID=CAMNT_0050631667 /DNA_START=257 /DNA_END=1190 /DNA_ORIENTATION=-
MVTCFVSTTFGRAPFLSEQLVRSLDESFPGVFCFSVGVGALGTKAMRSALQVYNSKASLGNIRGFLDIGKDRALLAVPMDAMSPAPDQTVGKGKDQLALSSLTEEKVVMNIDEYCRLSRDLMGAGLVVCPYECINGTHSRKHVDRALLRTKTWTQSCLTSGGSACKFYVPLVGGTVEQLEKCLENALSSKGCDDSSIVEGFVLCNVTVVSPALRNTMIETIVSRVGPEKPVSVLLGACSPADILDAISRGITSFETSLPYVLTKLNQALCFEIDLEDVKPGQGVVNFCLRDLDMAEDSSPIVEAAAVGPV